MKFSTASVYFKPLGPKFDRLIGSGLWWYLGLVVIGLIPRLIFTYGSGLIRWPDSLTYLRTALWMADQGDFTRHEIYRTPIYPIFLAGFFKVFGHGLAAAGAMLTAQRLIGICSGLLLFSMFRRVVTLGAAFLAAVLFLLSPLQLYYESCILTEVLFTFFLFAFLWLVVRILDAAEGEEISTRAFVGLGFVAAIMSLTRPIAQFLLPLTLLIVLFRNRINNRVLIRSALAFFVFLLGLLPWIAVNHHVFGFWGISQESGLSLFHRVLDIDQTPLPARIADRPIRRLYAAAQGKSGPPYFTVYLGLRRLYRVKSLEADRRMGAFALKVLKNSPGAFLPNTLRIWGKFFIKPGRSIHFCPAADGIPYLCAPQAGMLSQRLNRNPESLWPGARLTVRLLVDRLYIPEMPISLLALVGLGFLFSGCDRRTYVKGLLLVLTIFYFTGIGALFSRAEDRFRLPINGLVFGFAAFGLTEVLVRAPRILRSKGAAAVTPC